MPQVNGFLAALLGVSQTLYLMVVFTLGVRLMRRAVRTHQLPESLLATHFLLCAGLGYLLSVSALSAARQPGLVPPQLVTATIAAAHASSCVGVFAAICFNYLVFRRDEAWARALVVLAAVAMSVGYVGYGWTGGFQDGRFHGVWFWLFYGTFAWGAAWVMLEPLRYHRVMRRRQQLGLAEPLVVNRFLLWGVGSVCRFLMVLGGWFASAFYPEDPTELLPPVATVALVVIAIVGLGLSVSYYLTFFPPRAYERLVDRRSRAAGA